jgi:type I restriction enzyme S subunit
MKKYNNYKDSGIEWIGEIPEHWNVQQLKINTKIKTGYTPLTSDENNFSNEGTIWVKPDNLKLFAPIIDSKEKVSSLGVKQQNIIQKGSVLLCCIGTIGKFGVAGVDLLTNQQINSITFKDKLTNEYGKYLVFSFEDELNSWANGNVVRILNTTSLGNIKTPIPSEEEQTAIANYLDQKTTQIDQLINQKKRFIALLQEERTAVINQAVTKGLDPTVKMKDSGIEWLGEIPEHWEVKKLKLIFNSSKGLTITKENLQNEGIPCVNYGEIHSKFGFEVDIDKQLLKCVQPSYLDSDYKSLIKTGDFVFADTSEDLSGAGNFTYLKSNHEIFAGYHTIILRAVGNIKSRYFAYQFDSIPYRTQIRQSVKGIKVFSITQGILKNTSLWIPTLSEQELIIKFLDVETNRILHLKNSTLKEIELLKEYKTALISEVVTGKVDVRDVVLN